MVVEGDGAGSGKAGVSFDLLSVAVTTGSSLFVAASLNVLFGGGFFDRLLSLEVRSALIAFALLGAFAYSLFGCFKVVERIGEVTRSGMLPFASLACAVPCFAVEGFGSQADAFPLWVDGAAWALMGVFVASSAITWGAVWTQVDSLSESNLLTARKIALAAGCSGLLCFLTFFSPRIISVFAVLLFACGSTALQWFSLRCLPPIEKIDMGSSKRRFTFMHRDAWTPFFAGFFASAMAQVAIRQEGFEGFLAPLAASVVLGGSVLVVMLIAFKRVLKLSSLQRLIFPLLGICSLCLPYAGGMFLIALCCLAIACAVGFFTSFWNVLVALSYRHHTLPAYHYALGLVVPFAGLLAGWGLGFMLMVGGVSFGGETLAVGTVILLVLVITPGIWPPGANKWADKVGASSASGAGAPEGEDGVGRWRKRCEAVCSAYGLTARESEILPFLAKGRNAEYIGKELFISIHTVKSHMGRIYRKLGITSQQELIDLVERA